MVRKLTQMLQRSAAGAQLALGEPVMDVRRILRLMPHRYPMLLVDRVIEMDGDRRALGIKNVTMNEPFFEGHYPGTPMMPGVLIVERAAFRPIAFPENWNTRARFRCCCRWIRSNCAVPSCRAISSFSNQKISA